MTDAFPTVGFFRQGYNPEAVDAFFEDARRAYEGGVPAEQFSAEQVRQATFTLKRRGYDIDVVDGAMNRLEAAFVQRDRAEHVAAMGEAAWYDRVADRGASASPTRSRGGATGWTRSTTCWTGSPRTSTTASP